MPARVIFTTIHLCRKLLLDHVCMAISISVYILTWAERKFISCLLLLLNHQRQRMQVVSAFFCWSRFFTKFIYPIYNTTMNQQIIKRRGRRFNVVIFSSILFLFLIIKFFFKCAEADILSFQKSGEEETFRNFSNLFCLRVKSKVPQQF